MLHSIRDCSLVEESSEDLEIPKQPNTEVSNRYCCTNSCCGNIDYLYKVNNQETKVSVDGENVSISINGKVANVSLESIIKFYIGVE